MLVHTLYTTYYRLQSKYQYLEVNSNRQAPKPKHWEENTDKMDQLQLDYTITITNSTWK